MPCPLPGLYPLPLLFFLAWGENWRYALLLIVFAATSDMLDGELARRWGSVTALGKKLDAPADVAYSLATFAGLALGHLTDGINIIVMCYLVVVFSRVIFRKVKLIRRLAGCIAMPFWILVLGYLLSQYSLLAYPGVTRIQVFTIELVTLVTLVLLRRERLHSWVASR